MANPSEQSGSEHSRSTGTVIWSHKDIAVFVIGVIGAGVASLVGVFNIPRGWLFVCICAISALIALVVRALQMRGKKQQINALRLALAIAVGIPVGALVYHQWFDPGRISHPSSYPLQVVGADVDVFRTSDAAGKPPGYDYPPVIGGSTVQVSCYVILPSGKWYWIAGEQGWLPQALVNPLPGLAPPRIPSC